jgi:phosphoglycolate phosphatase-like HAD superfamily hydrolase
MCRAFFWLLATRVGNLSDNATVTKLIVFDLDGTLLDTNIVDSQCYADAWREEFSIDPGSLEWSSFANVTDSGIAEELLARGGLDPSAENLLRLENRFVKLLSAAALADRTRFRPIHGAVEMFERLSSAGWASSIATGAWRTSATIKLRAAGLSVPDVPLASCDRRSSRVEIVQHAIELAIRKACDRDLQRIVVLGDAVWDVQAARQLSLPFIGIGREEKGARLLEAGAVEVLADYSDFRAFAEALDRAVMPRNAG